MHHFRYDENISGVNHRDVKMDYKKQFFILVFMAFFSLFLMYSTVKLSCSENSEQIMIARSASAADESPEGKMKFILQWTSPDTLPFQYWGKGQEEFIRRNCTFNRCFVTSDRLFLKSITDFDAIAFHGPEIVNYKPGPRMRSPHQKYVYVSTESAHYYPICDKRYDGFFNWTWTYKLDSDEPYGYITVRDITGDIIGPNQVMHWINPDEMKPVPASLKKRLSSKKKAAAWFVSNCKALSKRQVFVRSLQKELDNYGLKIDIYGKCGRNKCPSDKMDECLKMVETDYYFYFSLENSFAEDYVTEKLLSALQNYAVPVVFGAANYTRFMPDGIYLHGGKMKTKDLAKEMKDIINDKERYYSFFKWRNHYSYHAREEAPDSDDLCRMCEMLHDEKLIMKTTVYRDFRKWWNVPGKCH